MRFDFENVTPLVVWVCHVMIFEGREESHFRVLCSFCGVKVGKNTKM